MSETEDVTRKRKADEIESANEEEKPPEDGEKVSSEPNDEVTANGDDPKDHTRSAMDIESSEKPPEQAIATENAGGGQIGSDEPKTQQQQQQQQQQQKESTTEDTPKEESKEKPSSPASSNPYDSLKYTIVRNDGKPESMIKLVGLKSLFAKQLPKMPRAYIARLVFDRRHTSLAILSDNPAVKDSDEEIIGGICYRAFPEMRFGEIAFCAVNATHQVKGYGTKLMNLLKKIGAETGIEYFITYADNYAIGYFKKQGFTKSVSMPKGRYFGLIKDYDGGTLMECYVHPSIDFTRIPQMIEAQRRFIMSRVEEYTNSRKVYDPLPKDFSVNLEGVSRANHAAARAVAIPGIREAGWTTADLVAATGQGKEADRQKSALKSELLGMVRKIEEQQFSWPFREPVDTNEVKDYLDIVKQPIDLSTIEKRIRQDNHYRSKQMLFADLMLMVNNCKLYNDEGSVYTQCAVSLEKFLGSLFHDMPSSRVIS